MEAVIKKWGNSLGVRIPSLMAKELALQDGSFVEIQDKGRAIIIKPKNAFRLTELLSLVNKNNLHGEIEAGGPVGREAW
ncbi:MAG: AbrB/MazE/SpoVT family DNA-binding domain-containing protein [Candidatus Margulisbacteria bacterium]|jgi:antitoxin MazE|nr:AbrB/MazE/SpoVT family DNA-binding domain-containing protein [Candidatus Margulisiibacteriota bacterium]